MSAEKNIQKAAGKELGGREMDILFREARTHNQWQDREVPEALLQSLYDLVKWGPTSANCGPARFVFVKSKEAKEKLKPALMEGNVEKTMAAPVTVIVAHDLKFYDHLPKLFPHVDAKSWFEGKEGYTKETAFRNSSLQGAYMMIAARALGLDCGPMSGFNKKVVHEAFFAGQDNIEINFICNIGYGDPAGLRPRNPRLSFDEACEIV